ncbi:hypothetical protein SAMN05421548_11364 [Paraburkholderia lycopersici]|uniref:Type 1 fimbrial protein n=1 Tax=Paraburkholderia lycopersici TaxID=416944 RepID=A0A1G6RAX7_9BURK|nr:hypothetical protein SAMN05421548_11364 [Paraburkholderia lycopersici]
MARRSIVLHRVLATSLLLMCSAGSVHASGVIHFRGMIVEPPCSLSAHGEADQMQIRTTCPRPAAGKVALVDTSNHVPLRNFRLTSQSQPIDLTAVDNTGNRSGITAIVTYR